jgi:hypothetical protein
MNCKEVLLSIIQRQTEGLMYHDEMTDYYAFLNLDYLKHLHKHQTKEELEALRDTKCLFISTFGMLPFYTATDPKVIPADWRTKSNTEITEASLRALVKSSLNQYLIWEQETCEIYKNAAKVFKDNMNFPLYRVTCELIEDVQKEINKIQKMMVDAAACDYLPSFFQ